MTRPHSLAAKLAAIGVGETIYLNDRVEPGKPTLMERAARNVIAKSCDLDGRTFSTERWIGVRHSTFDARPLLAVTRTT